MSQTGLSELDASIHKTNVWLKELESQLRWDDRHRAYHALRIVLQTLRDHLPVDKVASLGAQLPMVIRGFYYEGWHPAGKPLKNRRRDAFIQQVGEELDDSADCEDVVRAVFRVLNAHLSLGQADSVKFCLPEELRTLWPEVYKVQINPEFYAGLS